jgi:hypothetical protein
LRPTSLRKRFGPQRFDLGRAATAPMIVAHGPRSSAHLLLFFGCQSSRAPRSGPRAAEDEASLAPSRPGALVPRVWLGQDPLAPHQARIELRRLALEPNGRLRTVHREPVTGTFAPRRLTLLWQPERGLEPDGQLCLFAGGVYGLPDQVGPSDQPWAEQIVSMSIGPRGRGGGWLHRRFDPSPTAEATRLTEPLRTPPTASKCP